MFSYILSLGCFVILQIFRYLISLCFLAFLILFHLFFRVHFFLCFLLLSLECYPQFQIIFLSFFYFTLSFLVLTCFIHSFFIYFYISVCLPVLISLPLTQGFKIFLSLYSTYLFLRSFSYFFFPSSVSLRLPFFSLCFYLCIYYLLSFFILPIHEDFFFILPSFVFLLLFSNVSIHFVFHLWYSFFSICFLSMLYFTFHFPFHSFFLSFSFPFSLHYFRCISHFL